MNILGKLGGIKASAAARQVSNTHFKGLATLGRFMQYAPESVWAAGAACRLRAAGGMCGGDERLRRQSDGMCLLRTSRYFKQWKGLLLYTKDTNMMPCAHTSTHTSGNPSSPALHGPPLRARPGPLSSKAPVLFGQEASGSDITGLKVRREGRADAIETFPDLLSIQISFSFF